MRIRLLIIAVFMAGAILALQGEITAERKDYIVAQPRAFVPPVPQFVKAASLGYHNILADLYWIRIIQYREICWEQGVIPRDIYPMTDLLTDLDPRYCLAYFYSGMVMIDEVGDKEDIIALLTKGSQPENCEGYWKNPFLLGYIYYFIFEDYEKSATWMDLSCKWHEGHELFCGLATRIRAITGEPELGIQLIDEVFAQNQDPFKRDHLIKRRAELEAKIVERDLTAAAEQYIQKYGRGPGTIDDLFSEGPVIGTPPGGYRPVTYTGVPPHPLDQHIFVYDPQSQSVRSEPPIELGVRNKKKTPEADP